MEQHVVKVLKTNLLTHNVKRFVLEKPAGYSFISGQATDVSINREGLKDELRPFTFTSINEADHLEFSIKIYTGHNGITEQLLKVNEGDELVIHEVFGTIRYQGPGVFIAGGAGITPFISIFRQLKEDGKLQGNTLLFANRTAQDIILKDEFETMLGENFINVLEDQDRAKKTFIDKELLKKYIKGPASYYYICGPDKFTAAIVENLQDLGTDRSKIVIEE